MEIEAREFKVRFLKIYIKKFKAIQISLKKNKEGCQAIIIVIKKYNRIITKKKYFLIVKQINNLFRKATYHNQILFNLIKIILLTKEFKINI